MPFESWPAGLSGPSSSSLPSELPQILPASGPSGSFITSCYTTESTKSDGTDRQVEAITLATLHGMLARVLEQTNTIWQAQASTNHVLDELRRSIPAPQENAEIHERLQRVEALVLWQAQASTKHILDELRQSIPAPRENIKTDEPLRRIEALLAHSQSADLHPPAQPGQETGTISSAYQGRSISQSIPTPSFLQNAGKTPSCNAPVNPQPPPDLIISARETAHHMDPILHATCEQYPASGSNIHIHLSEDGEEQVRLCALLPFSESYSRGSAYYI